MDEAVVNVIVKGAVTGLGLAVLVGAGWLVVRAAGWVLRSLEQSRQAIVRGWAAGARVQPGSGKEAPPS